MARFNIYEGPSSCYALYEDVYVPKEGVNRDTASSILALILRDLSRGWTYGHNCEKMPMDLSLALRRARYLIPLSRKHYSRSESYAVEDIVNEVFQSGKIYGDVYLEGRNADLVYYELERKGIIKPAVRRRRILAQNI